MIKADTKSWNKTLLKILKKGILSPSLKEAIQETIKAIQKKDYRLACQLTACKSFISGEIDFKDKHYMFQEDEKANTKILGDSVYSLMDDLHHFIAYYVGSIPSGMMVAVSNGKTGYMREFQRKGKHPIIQRMEYEHNLIAKGIH